VIAQAASQCQPTQPAGIALPVFSDLLLVLRP